MKTNNLLALILLFLVISMASQKVMGRKCESPSSTFRGLCLKYSNCKQVCISEGFTDGECKGFRRRCYCSKSCD
ncbi:low-molecular-weight cysteine-rich 75 [Perilla frutescens var. frutescens]|nr:low-molecular-weight cysteine-rich 75 [Perilla frutescens var. frutescens]